MLTNPNSTNDWITNHLGKKPKNGGNPPMENRLPKTNIFIGFLKHPNPNNCFK
jgi:hypothetical protein